MAQSQKSIRDHARNRTHPKREDLVKPCVYQQLACYRSLGMKKRIVGLPLMLASSSVDSGLATSP